jgi:hypothetical protein
MSKSKFAGILQPLSQEQSEREQVSKENTVEAFSPLFEEKDHSQRNEEAAKPGVGGIRGGKKGNPDYCQVTAYLRRDTYNRARIHLLQRNDPRDFSELVEELVCQFLDCQAK